MILNLHHSVEKDGTGIEAREANGRHAIAYIRADITQDVFVEQGSSGCPDSEPNELSWRIRKPTWH